MRQCSCLRAHHLKEVSRRAKINVVGWGRDHNSIRCAQHGKRDHPKGRRVRDQLDGAQLTKREREVLSGLSRGLTSKEIGRELGLSPRTIEDVRARLLRKFEIKSTSELLGRMSYAKPRA